MPKTSTARNRLFGFDPGSGTVFLAGRTFALPASRPLRILIGVLLVLGGFLWFLPILGFWMLPLGLLVLSQDIPFVRRMRRKLASRYERWRRSRR